MIEFLLVLVALVVFGFAAMWLHAAFFDFVDKWKVGIRLQEERDRRIKREMLTKGRLPPMAPAGRYGMDHEPPAGDHRMTGKGAPAGPERRGCWIDAVPPTY